MCYNCGCGLPNDEMGKGHVHKGGGSLTEEAFEHIAKKWNMNKTDVKKETYLLLKKQFSKENNK